MGRWLSPLKKLIFCMTTLVVVSTCGGCASIIMTNHQDVELVNIPKNTRIETMHGMKFDLIPGRDVVDFKRSRDNPNLRIYCRGSKYPRRLKLYTYPNLAFYLGNFLLIVPIITHIADALHYSDRAWDYREPINIGAACRSATK